jgi:hypothetical protein
MAAARIESNVHDLKPKVSVKLPRRAKPSKALSRSTLRPKLTRAHVSEVYGQRELIITDSYVIGRIPVGEDVPLGPIAAEALKRIEKGDKHEFTDDGAIQFHDIDGTPITYSAPEQEDIFKNDPISFEEGRARTLKVALNPELLKALADALGASNGVRLEIPVDGDDRAAPRGIRVTVMNSAAEGLLMPIRWES